MQGLQRFKRRILSVPAKKIRPCDQSFGIDVFKTVSNVGFPIKVLQNKGDVQNRYGFVLIDWNDASLAIVYTLLKAIIYFTQRWTACWSYRARKTTVPCWKSCNRLTKVHGHSCIRWFDISHITAPRELIGLCGRIVNRTLGLDSLNILQKRCPVLWLHICYKCYSQMSSRSIVERRHQQPIENPGS